MKESYLEGLKIFILGCPSKGLEGLSKEAREVLDDCQIVFMAERFYKLFQESGFKNTKIIKYPETLNKLPVMIKEYYERGIKKIGIFATGDPNFFGITNFIKKFYPDNIEKVIPSISIMQEAFAKLKLNWEDAGFLSLHGRDKEKLLAFLLKMKKGFLFTSNSNDVLLLVKLLKEYRLSDFIVHIFENIGQKDESYFKVTYPYYLKRNISSLNVVIIERQKELGKYPGLGIDDESFEQKKGMITKREIRVNVLSLLELKEGMVLWDVGAGTGSVSIEATFNPLGVLVFAIEKDNLSFLNLKKNIDKFGAINVIPVFSDFKDVFDTLPAPDRIFIGGSGGNLSSILKIGYDKLKENGLILLSIVTLDNLNEVISFCKDRILNYDINGVLPVRGKKIKNKTIFQSQNPVYIVRIKK